MNTFFSRISDPGTMRSLIWVCLGVMGLPQTAQMADTIAGVVAIGLGVVSAAMKPKTTVQADTVVVTKQ